MPKIEVSRKDLFRLARIDDPGDPRLEEMLALVKGEIDSTEGDRLKLELNDTNRPDLWCVEGVARALRCSVHGPEEHLSDLPESRLEIRVDPELRDVRPFVAAFTACGWAPGPEELEALIEVQEKLAASFGRNRKTAGAGFYRLDEIRFPVDYMAASPETSFVPLGEEEEMTLERVLKETETGRNYAHILAGSKSYPVLRDAAGAILSFPPILNSQTTGRVRPGDGRLFCEVTGTDWETVQLTATILACNLQDRGAGIEPVRVVYPQDYPGETVECPVVFADSMTATEEQLRGILGVDIPAGRASDALRAMDYALVTVDGPSITGVLPPYRRDGIHAVDMIEDIAISMGLDSFGPLLPDCFTTGRSAPVEELADAVRLLLVGAGFEEVLRPVLTSREKVRETTRTPRQPVGIANPMTGEYDVVRNSLLPGLLEVESSSAHAAYPHRIFEAGEVLRADSEGACSTGVYLACLVSGNRADFGDIHSVLGYLCHSRGIRLSLAARDDERFVPGRCAEVMMDGRPAGTVGEVHPEVLHRWGIARPASALEVSLSSLRG
ncbi:MAG: phenylalanine--tRNA ligase subunit beta [Candidatus Aegiribacteria sp.]